MFSFVSSAIISGIDGVIVQTEADVSDGLPMFDMVGFLASEVRESKERVRTALKNCGYVLPAKRITVNLSPANIKKQGSGFDLPITIAVLCALEKIPKESTENTVFIGEMSLNGDINAVSGILPIVLKAKEEGFKTCVIPFFNAREASIVEGINIIPVKSITEAIGYCKGEFVPTVSLKDQIVNDTKLLDFADVNGQKLVKRACEISVTGLHNLLLVGPPGAGKSMIAQRIPTILPNMSFSEQIEVTRIYSVCGKLEEAGGLISKRPFRSPHHTISPQGLSGGGSVPKPGEVTLAHKGVLFLDELTEFNKKTLEILRQPMEDKKITISRTERSVTFPSDFLLVAALNPCQCGYYPSERCRCSYNSIKNYLGKISQPLLDRIDLCVEAKEVSFKDLIQKNENESSEDIRKRVESARFFAQDRFKDTGILFNSQIPSNMIETYCRLGDKESRFIGKMYEKLGLTARSYHKILKVARTIADLDSSESIKVSHLTEAICYRSIDKKYWEA